MTYESVKKPWGIYIIGIIWIVPSLALFLLTFFIPASSLFVVFSCVIIGGWLILDSIQLMKTQKKRVRTRFLVYSGILFGWSVITFLISFLNNLILDKMTTLIVTGVISIISFIYLKFNKGVINYYNE